MHEQKCIIMIGYSHLGSFYRAQQDELIDFILKPKFISINWGVKQEISEVKIQGKDTPYNPYVFEKINEYGGFNPKKVGAILSVLGSNIHNVFSMLSNLDQKFDFIVPGHDYLPFENNARCIEYSSVSEHFSLRLSQTYNILTTLSGECIKNRIPFFHASTPPVIPSNDFIYKKLDNFFVQKIEEDKKLSVSNKFFRYKCWLTLEKCFKKLCENRKINYVAPPSEVFDKNGFLKKDFWGNDATHASGQYGASILNTIFQQLGLKNVK